MHKLITRNSVREFLFDQFTCSVTNWSRWFCMKFKQFTFFQIDWSVESASNSTVSSSLLSTAAEFRFSSGTMHKWDAKQTGIRNEGNLWNQYRKSARRRRWQLVWSALCSLFVCWCGATTAMLAAESLLLLVCVRPWLPLAVPLSLAEHKTNTQIYKHARDDSGKCARSAHMRTHSHSGDCVRLIHSHWHKSMRDVRSFLLSNFFSVYFVRFLFPSSMRCVDVVVDGIVAAAVTHWKISEMSGRVCAYKSL